VVTGTVGGAEWAWLGAADVGFGAAGCVDELPDEPHAASVTASAAAAGSSRIRRRAGPLLSRFALSPLPRPGIIRIAMTSCPCVSLRFSWVIGTKDRNLCCADAQGHGRGLSIVK
jgi:hypothetical protein